MDRRANNTETELPHQSMKTTISKALLLLSKISIFILVKELTPPYLSLLNPQVLIPAPLSARTAFVNYLLSWLR